MRIVQVSGFAPITANAEASRALYAGALKLPLQAYEGLEEYVSTDDLAGIPHFGVWPLHMAAQSCFGTDEWPADISVPQATIDFEVGAAEEVAEAAAELHALGYTLVHEAKEEPWGQTLTRLMSPEGLLIGISYTPWHHE